MVAPNGRAHAPAGKFAEEAKGALCGAENTDRDRGNVDAFFLESGKAPTIKFNLHYPRYYPRG